MDDSSIAILERLEAVVTSLQDNSIKMGQLLAVHQEKLEQQEKIDDVLFAKIDKIHSDLHQKTDEIKKGCERDITLVKEQIQAVEKKIYVAAGALAAFAFVGAPAAQKILEPLLQVAEPAIMERTVNAAITDELPRFAVREPIVGTAARILD